MGYNSYGEHRAMNKKCFSANRCLNVIRKCNHGVKKNSTSNHVVDFSHMEICRHGKCHVGIGLREKDITEIFN